MHTIGNYIGTIGRVDATHDNFYTSIMLQYRDPETLQVRKKELKIRRNRKMHEAHGRCFICNQSKTTCNCKGAY